MRDINNNGTIDNGTELFGNNSVLSSGENALNGFEALKELDSNKDGVFNSSDEAWNTVKVWKDSNQNGIVDNSELLSLEQANIAGINLNYNEQELVDGNGNTHAQTGTIIKTDGSSDAPLQMCGLMQIRRTQLIRRRLLFPMILSLCRMCPVLAMFTVCYLFLSYTFHSSEIRRGLHL